MTTIETSIEGLEVAQALAGMFHLDPITESILADDIPALVGWMGRKLEDMQDMVDGLLDNLQAGKEAFEQQELEAKWQSEELTAVKRERNRLGKKVYNQGRQIKELENALNKANARIAELESDKRVFEADRKFEQGIAEKTIVRLRKDLQHEHDLLNKVREEVRGLIGMASS